MEAGPCALSIRKGWGRERGKKRFCCVEQHVEGHDGRKEAGPEMCFHDKQQSQERRSGSARVRDIEERRDLVFTSEKRRLTMNQPLL